MRLALLVALLVVAPTHAHAKKPRWKVSDAVDIRASTEPVSFYPERPRHTLDRGKLLYIGRGAVRDPEAVHVYDFATKARGVLRAPVLELARARPELSLKPVVEDLLCYDSADGVATVLLRANDKAPVHSYAARWDMKAERITGVWPLVERKPTTRWAGVHAVAYLPERRECLVQIEHNAGAFARKPGEADGPFDISVVAIGDGPRVLAAFSTERKLTHGPYIDEARSRVVVTEYAELAQEHAPKGHLVELATGEVTSFSIPKVCYGVAFDPDGKRLYAYGLKVGSIAVIDLDRGETVDHVKVVTYGHAVGWVAPGLLALASNGSMHLLDGKTLKTKLVVPSKAIDADISNIDGSMVLPGRVVYDRFEELFIVDVTP